MPDETQRAQLLRHFTAKFHFEREVNFHKLSQSIDGYSVSDIKSLSKEVFMSGLREVLSDRYDNTNVLKEINSKGIMLREKHFNEAIARVKASPSIEQSVYKEWSAKFGSH